MEVRVRGPVEVDRDGAALVPGGLKQRTVLALLIAARAGRCRWTRSSTVSTASVRRPGLAARSPPTSRISDMCSAT
ncbi:MAG: hypothetical protein OEW91_12180 [Acidimicrobiia bacterium]|nr:hypothetical protein [Acidimicrobiia bacterium]